MCHGVKVKGNILAALPISIIHNCKTFTIHNAPDTLGLERTMAVHASDWEKGLSMSLAVWLAYLV